MNNLTVCNDNVGLNYSLWDVIVVLRLWVVLISIRLEVAVSLVN